MTTLETKIKNAKTPNELQILIYSIKRQPNGFKNALANHLQNAFWYDDLIEDLEKQKIFMLETNPDQGLELISDLIRTSNCVVRIQKIDQSEMFLRSPRT